MFKSIKKQVFLQMCIIFRFYSMQSQLWGLTCIKVPHYWVAWNQGGILIHSLLPEQTYKQEEWLRKGRHGSTSTAVNWVNSRLQSIYGKLWVQASWGLWPIGGCVDRGGKSRNTHTTVSQCDCKAEAIENITCNWSTSFNSLWGYYQNHWCNGLYFLLFN